MGIISSTSRLSRYQLTERNRAVEPRYLARGGFFRRTRDKRTNKQTKRNKAIGPCQVVLNLKQSGSQVGGNGVAYLIWCTGGLPRRAVCRSPSSCLWP